MKPTKIRKQYTSKEDLKASSPEDLTSLIFGKAISNPEGWTARAGVDENLQRLHERDWSKKELIKHRRGRPKGAFSIVRKTIVELAPSCRDWPSMVAALRIEAHQENEVTDVDEERQQVTFRSQKDPIKFATLMDYFDIAKGWSKGTTRAAQKK